MIILDKNYYVFRIPNIFPLNTATFEIKSSIGYMKNVCVSNKSKKSYWFVNVKGTYLSKARMMALNIYSGTSATLFNGFKLFPRFSSRTFLSGLLSIKLLLSLP